jgi:hypothetical protein
MACGGHTCFPEGPEMSARRNKIHLHHRFRAAPIDVLIKFIKEQIGTPDYSATLTFWPIAEKRRCMTKVIDAVNAMKCFLYFLNYKCFGHASRRRGYEIGVFAALEGVENGEEQHWHCALCLPNWLSHEKFAIAFNYAIRKTKRLGIQKDLQRYSEGWFEYSLKTGLDSFDPEFLRPCKP